MTLQKVISKLQNTIASLEVGILKRKIVSLESRSNGIIVDFCFPKIKNDENNLVLLDKFIEDTITQYGTHQLTQCQTVRDKYTLESLAIAQLKQTQQKQYQIEDELCQEICRANAELLFRELQLKHGIHKLQNELLKQLAQKQAKADAANQALTPQQLTQLLAKIQQQLNAIKKSNDQTAAERSEATQVLAAIQQRLNEARETSNAIAGVAAEVSNQVLGVLAQHTDATKLLARLQQESTELPTANIPAPDNRLHELFKDKIAQQFTRIKEETEVTQLSAEQERLQDIVTSTEVTQLLELLQQHVAAITTSTAQAEEQQQVLEQHHTDLTQLLERAQQQLNESATANFPEEPLQLKLIFEQIQDKLEAVKISNAKVSAAQHELIPQQKLTKLLEELQEIQQQAEAIVAEERQLFIQQHIKNLTPRLDKLNKARELYIKKLTKQLNAIQKSTYKAKAAQQLLIKQHEKKLTQRLEKLPKLLLSIAQQEELSEVNTLLEKLKAIQELPDKQALLHEIQESNDKAEAGQQVLTQQQVVKKLLTELQETQQQLAEVKTASDFDLRSIYTQVYQHTRNEMAQLLAKYQNPQCEESDTRIFGAKISATKTMNRCFIPLWGIMFGLLGIVAILKIIALIPALPFALVTLAVMVSFAVAFITGLFIGEKLGVFTKINDFLIRNFLAFHTQESSEPGSNGVTEGPKIFRI